jgi:hypothetical protein
MPFKPDPQLQIKADEFQWIDAFEAQEDPQTEEILNAARKAVEQRMLVNDVLGALKEGLKILKGFIIK